MTFTGTPSYGTATQYVRAPCGTEVALSIGPPGPQAPAAGVDS